ncbi:MAG: hypothetical protein IJY88_01475, partial [Clostridia bacterium]|nr:hypothetical protein [Clostridia bacterium]
FFDRSDAIRLVFTINGTYANKAIDYITVITDNFKWQRQDPFPEGMLPYYSSYGKYEFVYPAEWNTGISNNVYLIQDPSSGSAISVMANESSVTYEKFSKLDYANYAANGRSSYVLQHFSSDNNVIYAEGSYMSGNTNMILVQYLIATGKYEYAITFEVPKSHFEEQAELMQKIINTFRIYT